MVDDATLYKRRWQVLAVLCLSLILIGLDTLVLQLALPSIQRDLSATGSELQWVIDAYTVTFGGLLLLTGGLSDRFGRKRTLTIGLLVFLAFSLVSAVAPSSEALIAARAGMGLGAALIMPATLAIIKAVFPPEEQGKAIGIWSGAAAIGVPLGPAVSGLLLEHFWWGSVFLINVPVVAVALIAGFFLVPESRAEHHPGLDLVGAALSVAGLVALVYGVVEAPRYGWLDPATLAPVAAGIVLLALFVLWEQRTEHPMLSIGLFREPRYGGGALGIAAVAFGLFSALFVITQYLQSVLGLDPLEAGIRMLAVGTIVIGAPLSPKLVETVGLKITVAAGLVVCAAGLGLMATLDGDSQTQALLALAVLGLGVGVALPAATDAIMVSAPQRQAGAGSAVADASMQIGGSLGIAATGSVLSTSYRDALPDLPGLPPEAAGAVRDSLGGAVEVATRLGGVAGEQVRQAAAGAFVDGLGGTLLVSIVVAVVGALVAAAVLPRDRQPAESPAAEPVGTARP